MTDDRYGGQVPPPPPTTTVPAHELWAASQPTYHGPAVAPPGRRVPRWIMAMAVATAVASVTAFTVVLLWPASDRHVPAGPLAFHGFFHVNQLTFDQPSNTVMTTVQGERGYVAWEQAGNLRILAFDIATGEEHWRQTVSGAPRWGRLMATDEVLLVLAAESSASTQRRLFARDPATGDERWDTQVRGDDRLFFTDRTLGWLDRETEALRGIDLVTGDERWAHQFEGSARAIGVTTPAVLAQPTNLNRLASPVGDDHRIVLVTPDRTVRVFDGYDGGLLTERVNVTSPDNLLLAYEDHLFVAAEEAGYRVESYSLNNLAEPSRAIYSASDLERYPDALEPCGQERICVLDTLAFDDETAEVTAIDVVDGGEVWRQEVPGAEWVLPIGEWLGIGLEIDFDPYVTVLDGDGELWQEQPRPGTAVRLNDGNLLIIDRDLTAAVGFAVETGQLTGLGPLPEAAAAEACAWNDRHIVCVARATADIWRFAES